MKILTGYLINNEKDVISQYSINVTNDDLLFYLNKINESFTDIKTEDEYIIYTIEEYTLDNRLKIRTENANKNMNEKPKNNEFKIPKPIENS